MDREVSTNQIITRKKILINGSIFLGLILLTFYVLFRDNNINDVINVMLSVDEKYVLISILCMCVFVSCEAINIGRSLKLFQYKIGFFTRLKYALVGFFFSAVTPSASGGQPMQLYFMHKDRIKIGHSTLALLMDLASYQFITVFMAVIGLITNYGLLDESLGKIKYLLIIGVILNTLALAIILIAIFSKRLMRKLIDLGTFLLTKFKYKKVNTLREKAITVAKEYENSAVYFRENKLTIVKILITTLIQLSALNSIPFWIYKSFGLSGYSIGSVIALQSVLFITVSALPLPGAVGVSESGFMIMFRTLFPTQIISAAMLLSRGISFYLCTLISGLIILVVYVFTMKRKIYQEEVGEKMGGKRIEL